MIHSPIPNPIFDSNPIIPRDQVGPGNGVSANWLNSVLGRAQAAQDVGIFFLYPWSEAVTANPYPRGELCQRLNAAQSSHVDNEATQPGGAKPSTGAYYIIPSDDHIVIDNYSAPNGDFVTFLGQFTNAEHLTRHIDVTVPSNGENGDLIVTSETGFKAIFLGAGDDTAQFVDSVIDFTPAGKTALSVADKMNDADEAEIEAFLASLGTELFETLFRGLCGALLLANLTAQSCAVLLNSFDQKELADILGDIGSHGMSMILAEMTEGEIGAFFQNVGSEVMITLTTQMGNVVANAINAGFETARWFWADGNDLFKSFDETSATPDSGCATVSLDKIPTTDFYDVDPLGDV